MPQSGQQQPVLLLETPLGENVLRLRSFEGAEEISSLFQFHLDMVSEDINLDIHQLVGKPVSFGVKTRNQRDVRWFHGYVSHAYTAGEEDRLAVYHAEVVPWLWFLTRTADCRVNQNVTVPEVVIQTFHKFGFKEYEKRLKGNYSPWEYCNQYRESAFHFVSRLMEAEGIYYFFRHERGQHTLVLADSPSSHTPCPLQPRARMQPAEGRGAKLADDPVRQWSLKSRFRSGKYIHRDFNFLKPEKALESEVGARAKKQGAQRYEIYDYPGEYEERKDGDDWAQLRMEEEELGNEYCEGAGECRAFSPGFRFDLYDHDRRDQNKTYLLTAVRHSAREGSIQSSGPGQPATYSNTFSCLPASLQYRPQRKTPKHLMRGAQTATVVGPKSDEIYTNEHGQIRVRFHWDREDKPKADDYSPWIRVSQPWAGKGWGAMFLPRVGQEVLVDFLEGDPDRPIVVGRVYNAQQTVPWELPANKNWSGIKSYSTKGGGPENYNEIRFDDTKGKEVFTLHAERDMNISVERDTEEVILRDRKLLVKQNQQEEVKKDKQSIVGGSLSEQIGDRLSITVGSRAHHKAGQDYALEAGADIHLKASGRIILEAAQGITFLGAGGSFIDVGFQGVTIQGPFIFLNCGQSSPPSGKGSQPLKPEEPDFSEAMKKRMGAAGAAGAAPAAALPTAPQLPLPDMQAIQQTTQKAQAAMEAAIQQVQAEAAKAVSLPPAATQPESTPGKAADPMESATRNFGDTVLKIVAEISEGVGKALKSASSPPESSAVKPAPSDAATPSPAATSSPPQPAPAGPAKPEPAKAEQKPSSSLTTFEAFLDPGPAPPKPASGPGKQKK